MKQGINLRNLLRMTLILCIGWSALACSSTRYVPADGYLLRKNKIQIDNEGRKKRRDRILPGELMPYVQQRPNGRLLGVGFYLGVYNATDTSKTKGWHRFWREKIGEAPVIWDSSLTDRSVEQMTLYLADRGYLNAVVEDSVIFHPHKRKVQVLYTVQENRPYTVSRITYQIDDDFLEPILLEDTTSSLLRAGMIYDRNVFDAERERITERLQNMGFWGFNKGYIHYVADTAFHNHTLELTMHVRRRVASQTEQGIPILENHPIYRINRITVNSDYDPTKSPQEMAAMNWDTITYNGVDILYRDKLYLRRSVLVGALRLSPNELYDRSGVQRTYGNIRNLQYSANILFEEQPYDTLSPIVVTRALDDGDDVSTTERYLNCFIQCTPSVRMGFNTDAELSITADYYSAALTLGYNNKNLFRGAENFTINFRGAYELMKTSGKSNSHELGVSMGLDIPRFLIPVRADRLARFQQQKTNLAFSISRQRRPDYDRTIFSGTFGYSWSLRNGARFQINPADINIVSVPWVNPDFLNTIDNPYLKNSYQSQLIAGLSAGYYYQKNPNRKANSFAVRITSDVNGNLFGGLAHLFGHPVTINPGTDNEERYHRILGIRYAQYARLSIDLSQRVVTTATTQFAWRLFLGGGKAYANSNTLPFERLYFAGGSNSMRGWQVRTLGPGSTPYQKESFPNQLGDLRLEANMEYRFDVVGDFGMAIFLDAGNIWMNSKGSAPDARFKFGRFYKQIALNTGLGLRYDFGFVFLRLDWGIKLHNPNVPSSESWNKRFKLNDTALHFAIGLPF